jgi:hypothetical protein
MPGTPQTLQVPPPVSVQTILYNTYLQIISGGNTPAFVGPLDTLVSQGATIARAWSQRRLLSTYTGPADILRGNGSGSPEATINYLANGAYDLTAAEAARVAGGGTQAFRKTWYDQSTNATNASQSTAANQPPFTTSVRARGAIGGIASSDCYLPFTLTGLTKPFFVFIVATALPSGTRYLFGTTLTISRFLYVDINADARLNYGTNLNTTGSVITDITTIGALVNGASSAIYADGSLIQSGNSGTTAAQTSWRIGSAGTSASSWFTDAGNTISEMIIFQGNPTLLAGWSAFETAAMAYYA